MIAAAFVVALGTRIGAVDPNRPISQYIIDRWESDRGFPGGAVNAITQTDDGYLWIAAEKGLVRFDGWTFRLFDPPTATSGRDSNVLFLAPERGGSLWAELRSATLVRFQHEDFVELPPDLDPLRLQPISAMTSGKDGEILLAVAAYGLLARRGDRTETVVSNREMPSSFVIAMAQASDGDLWLGTRDSGLLRLHAGRLTRIVNGLPDQKINTLLPRGDHGMWIGTDNGIAVWDGEKVTQAGVPPGLERTGALAMIHDRESNVWVRTAGGALLRVNDHGVATLEREDREHRRAVTAVFEDRDGNLWLGTTRGIERVRDGMFTSLSSSPGLPAGSYGPVYAAADRIWFAPASGGVFWQGNDRTAAARVAGIDQDVVYSISGGDGDVWVGRQRGGLTRLRAQGDHLTVQNFTQSQGLAQNNVYAVERTRDGSVWAGTLSAGASLLRHGSFTTFTTADGLASNTVSAIVEGTDGTVWFATPNGVSARTGGTWHRYSVGDGLPSNDINTVFEDSRRNVWIGTAAGLALFREGRILVDFQPPRQLRGSVFAIVEDRVGWLWIATADRILRVNRDRLVLGSGEQDLHEFGQSDGLLGIEGVKRHRSVAIDGRGRIWISTDQGLSVADPSQSPGRAAPALTHVEDLSADGTSLGLREGLTVPARRQRVTLQYTGLSLAAPERILFRYRLDGFDHDWSAPSTARHAEYTNLHPGPYTFRVIASNSDGLWNGVEATLPFSIAPAFWQTMWFQISGILLFCAAVGGAYRLRVAQMSRKLHARFEERLVERTRIAQELHDTLLQGFVSASMQLHVATDRLPADSTAKPALTKVQNLMAQVIDEGRNAVRGLRSPSLASRDLAKAFSGISGEFASDGAVSYRVIVEGRERPLKPMIRDEVYRIGHEAVVNAFRHAEAKTIELQLEYASRGLRLLVRDDGHGIDETVMRAGREGHWGLSGMRERAHRIGARFTVWSSATAGTEIELSVPARAAFAREKQS